MATRKKTHFAVLGLLSWKPMSGYDIKKFVEVEISHFWNESYGQIFPTLNHLVDEGFATKEQDPGSGRRKRFLYTITRSGREALEEWLRFPTEPVRTRNEVLLKFFLSCRRPTEDALRLHAKHRNHLEERLEEYTEAERGLAEAVRSRTLPDEVKDLIKPDTEADTEAGLALDRGQEALVIYLTLRQGILVLQARLAWCDEATAALQSKLPGPGAPL